LTDIAQKSLRKLLGYTRIFTDFAHTYSLDSLLA
jgi:hypothetical protein